MTFVQEIAISKLRILKNNPRRISKDQMDKLVKSIQDDPKFLQCRPILVNLKGDCNKKEYIVYAGNQRVQAAKKLKWKTIPCIIEDNLDEELMKQRIIKDNKSYGEFDFDILANIYEIETLLDCGFQDFELSIDTSGKTIEEVLEEEKESKGKKKKECPNCHHIF